MKRGRPKGRSRDTRSFGPLGDLIRRHRLARQLGLLDVAKAAGCSVQFISNIEHGRAPLPWDKVGQLASFLRIPVDQLQAANLAIRSDFKSFVGKKVATPKVLQGVAYSARDASLREIIQRYQASTPASRKKFVKAALRML
jgi:transcriptional regulator with XRE-family HTH domain